ALVRGAGVGDVGAHLPGALDERRRDAHGDLPGGVAGCTDRAPRRRLDRRRRCLGPLPARHAADDHAGRLLQHGARRDHGAPGVHVCLRRDGRRPGLRDLVLRPAHLQERLQLLQHGLRLSARLVVPAHHRRADLGAVQDVAPLGLLRRGRRVMAAVVLERRAARVGERRRSFGVALTYLGLLLAGLLFAFPFIWTVTSSLKTPQEMQVFPPSILPEVPQWRNYVELWTTQPIPRWILNSLIIVLVSVPGAIFSGSLVAYSFARFDYPGRGFFFALLLSTLMLPFEVTLIPQYLLFYQRHWIDTFLPLTVPAWFGNSAVTVFLLRQFFMT